MTEPYLIELKHISQMYGRADRRFTAVHDVSFAINSGELVALLGPSGCGKSTLLRTITGLNVPTEGEVLYRDQPLKGVNPHATIVFQTFALFPWLTVQQNVEVALKARGMAERERGPRAVELLDMVGLDGFERAYPRELSGGMRQKVGFARALAVEPELLCLDEAFSALDVLSAETLRGELLELWSSGKIPIQSILMVTHNIEEAILMADRILIMDKQPGRLVAHLPVLLPRPRQRKDPAFLALLDQIYATMAGQTQPEHIELGSAPGEAGPTRLLPDVTVNALAGLFEHLNDAPDNKADIYRIEQDLKLDSDHLLRLMETAELLGFVTIASGDITLSPLGETFAEASILARKEIFAGRLKRLPLFRWLLALLGAAEEHRLDRDVIRTALELEFAPGEAEQQTAIALAWGRYAELIAYDTSTDAITLESPASVPAA
ncbi:MAG TPA: nitrate/sulfonate/bicarbonate ABC transporter ATP-binding protein [Aggregatilinea sp.]|uniref:ABC transporter ATP-binding protein n=1 Tax=Aggregatilinea sp. TaxID=2806333 RepID=UPI002C81C622|nr:nitrate/sulfonate/bicarbonate ABC transporter ATP-binding protein [Aggregatilinea sp.]HML21444.1 nitrate/sulfonate/bicarbonate ABC transporter ATP-binding protein [Aggregatilinea sp.]